MIDVEERAEQAEQDALVSQVPNSRAPRRPPVRLPTGDAWPILRAVSICLAILLVLNTQALIATVERRPSGPVRAILLPAARGLDGAAGRVGLDRPMAWFDHAQVGRDEAPRFAAPSAGEEPVPPAPSDAPAPSDPAAPSDAPAPADAPAPSESPAPTAAETPVAAASAPPAAPPTPTVPAGPTATPTPPPRRAVTAANPLRVYVAGDSFVNSLAEVLAETGERNGLMTVLADGKPLSGLSQPEFLNWPARVRQALANRPAPDVIVFMAGANDGIKMQTPNGILEYGTEAWNVEYARRAGELMDAVGQGGARLYYVGQPIMRDSKQSRIANDINVAAATEAAKRPWVVYVDSWTLLADKNGAYSTFLTADNGEVVKARADDGIHLTPVSTVWVANAAYAAIRRDWGLAK